MQPERLLGLTQRSKGCFGNMEQREKSVGADVSAMSDHESDQPERHRARAPVPVETSTAVAARREGRPKGKKSSVRKNRLRETRIEKMMSKAELARRANLSVLTIDRVEKGLGCRMDTKRKILEALGMSLADRVRVFGEEE
jgi:DNA-binding XRE family transcriptional regulator